MQKKGRKALEAMPGDAARSKRPGRATAAPVAVRGKLRANVCLAVATLDCLDARTWTPSPHRHTVAPLRTTSAPPTPTSSLPRRPGSTTDAVLARRNRDRPVIGTHLQQEKKKGRQLSMGRGDVFIIGRCVMGAARGW